MSINMVIDKLWCIYSMEDYTIMKKEQTTSITHHESISHTLCLARDVRQKKNTYFMSPFI